jgi:hypothetical protein
VSTEGQRWRRRRNIAIAILHVAGMSQRTIADIFDLPRSHVGVILKQIKGETGETGRGRDALDRPVFRGWYQAALMKTARRQLRSCRH